MLRILRRSMKALVLFALGTVAPAVCGDVQMNVEASDGAQYTTVQAAINAVPANSADRYVINIAPGTYTEQVRVNKPNVTLRGTGVNASQTILTYHETAQPGNSLANASTAIQAKDFIAQNLTFRNPAAIVPEPGSALVFATLILFTASGRRRNTRHVPQQG